jgi:hypothetical protein
MQFDVGQFVRRLYEPKNFYLKQENSKLLVHPLIPQTSCQFHDGEKNEKHRTMLRRFRFMQLRIFKEYLMIPSFGSNWS